MHINGILKKDRTIKISVKNEEKVYSLDYVKIMGLYKNYIGKKFTVLNEHKLFEGFQSIFPYYEFKFGPKMLIIDHLDSTWEYNCLWLKSDNKLIQFLFFQEDDVVVEIDSRIWHKNEQII